LIVPVARKGGSSGGRNLAGDREAQAAEVIACNQTLIRGLWISRTTSRDEIAPPADVVRA